VNTENTEATAKKDAVPSKYRERYKATGGTSGDFIATELQAIGKKDGPDSVSTIQAENGIERERWATFNPGMRRMNLANVLRGRYLKGETISILGKQYNARHRAEDYTGTIAEDDKSLSKLAEFLELNVNDRVIGSLREIFFPKAKGPTAEEKAAAKAEREAEKAAAKAAKEAEKEAAKADRAAKAADDKAVKEAAKEAAKAEREAAKEAAKAEKAAAKEAAKAEKAAAKATTKEAETA